MKKENNDISFSDLHLNIKSLNQNFESPKHLLVELNFCFKIPKKKKKKMNPGVLLICTPTVGVNFQIT